MKTLLNLFTILAFFTNSFAWASSELTIIPPSSNEKILNQIKNFVKEVTDKAEEIEKQVGPKTKFSKDNPNRFTEMASKKLNIDHRAFEAAATILYKNITFVSTQNKKADQFIAQIYEQEIKEIGDMLLSSKKKYVFFTETSMKTKDIILKGISAYLSQNSGQKHYTLSVPSQLIPTVNHALATTQAVKALGEQLKVDFTMYAKDNQLIKAGKLFPPIIHLAISTAHAKQPITTSFISSIDSDSLAALKQEQLYNIVEPNMLEVDLAKISEQGQKILIKQTIKVIEKEHSVVFDKKIADKLSVVSSLEPVSDLFVFYQELLKDIVLKSKTDQAEQKKISYNYVEDFLENKYNKKNIFNQGLFGVNLNNKQAVMAEVLQLGSRVKNQLIGQDDAVNKIAQAVESHYLKKERTTPLSIFAIGLTGVGKTELGNLVSKYLYGSNSFTNFALGNFSHIGDLNNLFGSAKGYIGSDEVSPFEKFLSEHPKGGVIIFDEASNMGGESKADKIAMFKRFYELLEEGRWTAPKSGVTYELGNYIFLFTGNDGEKIFRGMTNETAKNLLWKDHQSRSAIFDILIESGVPEAFLGRLNEVFLFKPVTKKTAAIIAEKFIIDFEKNYEFKIEYINKKQFYSNLVQAMFFSAEGARSVRNFIENRLGSYVIRASEEALKKGEQIKSIKIDWIDNLNGRVYAAKSFKRKSVLQLQISTDVNPKYSGVKTIDVSSDIIKTDMPTINEVKKTAYHETGHAFLNEKISTLNFITVIAEKFTVNNKPVHALGYAHSTQDAFASMHYKDLVNRVAMLLAGGVAEKLSGFTLSAGRSNDLEQARNSIQYALLNGVLVDNKGLEFIRLSGEGHKELVLTKKQEKLLAKEVDKIIKLANTQAVDTLTKKWSNVEKLVKVLIQKGVVLGKDIRAIENDTSIRELWEPGANFKLHKVGSCKSLF